MESESDTRPATVEEAQLLDALVHCKLPPRNADVRFVLEMHCAARDWRAIMTDGDKRDRPEEISPTAGEEGGSLSRLSPLQLQVLSRLRQNMQHKAIAYELGVSEDELARQIRHILTSIGARDRAALVVIVDGLEHSDRGPLRRAAV